MKNRRGERMPDETVSVSDDIDEAEALLLTAGGMSENVEESTSLSTRAIGLLLLLYFAKEQRDATKKIEEMITHRAERRLADLDELLKVVMSAMPGGK
jgi:hypothetical protein